MGKKLLMDLRQVNYARLSRSLFIRVNVLCQSTTVLNWIKFDIAIVQTLSGTKRQALNCF